MSTESLPSEWLPTFFFSAFNFPGRLILVLKVKKKYWIGIVRILFSAPCTHDARCCCWGAHVSGYLMNGFKYCFVTPHSKPVSCITLTCQKTATTGSPRFASSLFALRLNISGIFLKDSFRLNCSLRNCLSFILNEQLNTSFNGQFYGQYIVSLIVQTACASYYFIHH